MFLFKIKKNKKVIKIKIIKKNIKNTLFLLLLIFFYKNDLIYSNEINFNYPEELNSYDYDYYKKRFKYEIEYLKKNNLLKEEILLRLKDDYLKKLLNNINNTELYDQKDFAKDVVENTVKEEKIWNEYFKYQKDLFKECFYLKNEEFKKENYNNLILDLIILRIEMIVFLIDDLAGT